MTDVPPCPECRSAYVYADGDRLICPECGHEWDPAAEAAGDVVADANGAPLADGDTVVVVKDLRLKGGGGTVKAGTRVKNIRLAPGADHDIDCRIDGSGAMGLKSQFVRKA